MSTQTLTMSVDGPGLTDLIRNTWCSDLPLVARRMVIEGLPGTTEQHFHDIVSGKSKLENDEEDRGTLNLVDDGTDVGKKFGMDITFEGRAKATERKYKSLFGALNALQRTDVLLGGVEDEDNPGTLKSPGLPTPKAGKYRREGTKKTYSWDDSEESINLNKERIEKYEEELLKVGENLEYLYSLIGDSKSFAKFMMIVVKEVQYSQIELEELEHAAEILDIDSRIEEVEQEIEEVKEEIKKGPTEKEIAEFKESVDTLNTETEEYNKSLDGKLIMTDEEIERNRDLSLRRRTLQSIINHDLKLTKDSRNLLDTIPIFSDPVKAESEHCYILPDGRLYETGFQGHTYLEEELKSTGQIEKGFATGWTVHWMEAGWIKISSAEVMMGNAPQRFYNEDIMKDGKYYPTPDVQWETLTNYLLSRNWDEFRNGFGGRENFSDPMELIKELKEHQQDFLD